MAAPTLDLVISQGKTLTLAMRLGLPELVYKPVSAIVQTAPARLTVPAHGLPSEWPVRIESAATPLELNTAGGQWKNALKIDANTIEFNEMNLSAAKPLTGPAVMIYRRPRDITGWKFRMQIRDKVGGALLLDASSDVADAADGTITLDVVNSSFTVEFTDETTAAITWLKGVYDIEAMLPDGTVVQVIAPSKVTIELEVTAWT